MKMLDLKSFVGYLPYINYDFETKNDGTGLLDSDYYIDVIRSRMIKEVLHTSIIFNVFNDRVAWRLMEGVD